MHHPLTGSISSVLEFSPGSKRKAVGYAWGLRTWSELICVLAKGLSGELIITTGLAWRGMLIPTLAEEARAVIRAAPSSPLAHAVPHLFWH